MEKIKKYADFINLNINYNGFSLGPTDAYNTYMNILTIFNKKTGFFSTVKPMHINDLKLAYKNLHPQMEFRFPGVIDQMIQPEIVKQLGFPVVNNLVYMGKFAL